MGGGDGGARLRPQLGRAAGSGVDGRQEWMPAHLAAVERRRERGAWRRRREGRSLGGRDTLPLAGPAGGEVQNNIFFETTGLGPTGRNSLRGRTSKISQVKYEQMLGGDGDEQMRAR